MATVELKFKDYNIISKAEFIWRSIKKYLYVK